jgi:hypothetical protein
LQKKVSERQGIKAICFLNEGQSEYAEGIDDSLAQRYKIQICEWWLGSSEETYYLMI